MQELAKQLAAARARIEKYNETLVYLETAFSNSAIGETIQAARAELACAKIECAQHELKLRAAAEANYVQTADKKPCDGVGIRITKELEYDVPRAIRYCIKKKLAGALSLKKRDFERAALAMTPKFVAIREVPKATISRDLSGYLEVPE